MNIAEIELSVLARGCLARRIPDLATLAQELRAWQRDRNQSAKGIRFCLGQLDQWCDSHP